MTSREWVACSVKEFGAPGERRHLLRDKLTTRCGITASHTKIWRANNAKADCWFCASGLHRLLPDETILKSDRRAWS